MTQDTTRAAAIAGPDPVRLLIQLNRQTGAIVVTGPVEAPALMLEMLARAVAQVARLVARTEAELAGSELVRPRIVQ